MHRPAELRALAKLTLSLRVTGVRDDGYHLLDAEMVTIDLADTLTFAEGDGLEIVGGPPGLSAGDEAYGAVSVKVAYWAEAAVVGRVPASVFVPRPNVESALVRIVRRPHPAVEVAPDVLFPLVRAGFAQRRKMLRRSLQGLVDADAFACAGIRPEARAEELDVAAWGRLAACTTRPSSPPSPS